MLIQATPSSANVFLGSLIATFLLTFGCNSAQENHPVDAGQEAAPVDVDSSGKDVLTDQGPGALTDALCVGSIDEVQNAAFHTSSGPACPATYDEAMLAPPKCGPATTQYFGMCNGVRFLSADCLVHGFICAYDASSMSLVGATAFDDVPGFCGKQSSCIQGGTLPVELSCAGRFNNTCISPDQDGGGSDAGDGG